MSSFGLPHGIPERSQRQRVEEEIGKVQRRTEAVEEEIERLERRENRRIARKAKGRPGTILTRNTEMGNVQIRRRSLLGGG